MKTFAIILLALVAATGNGFGQNLIAVQSGGEPEFYTKLDLAITNAQNGDTVYLPGGFFQIDSFVIDKQLYIFGAGSNPDSSSATIHTRIDCSIVIEDGADGGFLTGINLQNGSILIN